MHVFHEHRELLDRVAVGTIILMLLGLLAAGVCYLNDTVCSFLTDHPYVLW